MLINAEEILKNLELISFPRLAGTIHEERAFNIIRNKIQDKGIEYFIQKFTFTTFYSKFLPKILFSLLFLLLFSVYLENIGFLWFNILIIMIFSIFLINPIKIKLGKKIRSQNLYVRYLTDSKRTILLNPNNNDNFDLMNILFIAHVDSKGQRFSIKIRIFSYKLWATSFFPGLLFIIMNDIIFSNLYFYIIEIVLIGINLVAVFLIILNSTNNKSPGALDNASGVACVLELLKYYSNKEHSLNNYNLWFLFTGAEELGTMGIRHFYDTLMDFNREKTYVINFDSIGKKVSYFSSSINPKKKREIYHIFLQIAKKINLKLGFSSSTFGVRSDGLYLQNQNFHGFGFGDPSSFKHIHSINDTVDKVEANLLKKLCNFIINALKEIDGSI